MRERQRIVGDCRRQHRQALPLQQPKWKGAMTSKKAARRMTGMGQFRPCQPAARTGTISPMADIATPEPKGRYWLAKERSPPHWDFTMTTLSENQVKFLRLLDDFLIEIRALEAGREADAKLIANALHKFAGYFLHWDEVEVGNYVADMEARLSHPQTEYLKQHLRRSGL